MLAASPPGEGQDGEPAREPSPQQQVANCLLPQDTPNPSPTGQAFTTGECHYIESAGNGATAARGGRTPLSCHSTRPWPLAPPCTPRGPIPSSPTFLAPAPAGSEAPDRRARRKGGTASSRPVSHRRIANPGSEKVGSARRWGRSGSQGAVRSQEAPRGSPVRSAETTSAAAPRGLSLLLKVSLLLLPILTSHVHPRRSEAKSDDRSLPSAFS